MSVPRIVVTGFGPFPGVPENPSEVLALRIAARQIPGVEVHLLPTVWRACETMGETLAGARRALMFGVSGRARRIHYERVARADVADLFDAAWHLPTERPASSRYTALDVTVLARAARAAGYPVVESANAGHYICNAAYGAALTRVPETLFVHIPQPTRFGPLSMDGLEAHALWLLDRLSRTGSPRPARPAPPGRRRRRR